MVAKMANVDHVIGALVIAVSATALAEIALSLPRGKTRTATAAGIALFPDPPLSSPMTREVLEAAYSPARTISSAISSVIG
jgi:hypothetical protein